MKNITLYINTLKELTSLEARARNYCQTFEQFKTLNNNRTSMEVMISTIRMIVITTTIMVRNRTYFLGCCLLAKIRMDFGFLKVVMFVKYCNINILFVILSNLISTKHSFCMKQKDTVNKSLMCWYYYVLLSREVHLYHINTHIHMAPFSFVSFLVIIVNKRNTFTKKCENFETAQDFLDLSPIPIIHHVHLFHMWLISSKNSL